jgi:autotransporter-associated beta strand protein
LHDDQYNLGASADFHFVNPSNTYSGTITLDPDNDGAKLFIDADIALSNSTIIINGNSDANSNAIVFATSAPIIGGVASNGNFAIPAGVTLSVGNDNASTLYSGIISSNGALTKVGTGTLTLTGTNTYSGNTTVSAGTLALAGDGSVASPVIIVNGTLDVTGHTGGGITIAGTLAGSGTVTGAVTIANGATLSPGNSPGTLTIKGDLVLNNTSQLQYDLGTGGNDLTAVNGSLTLTGTVNVAASGTFGVGDYTLISYTGALTGSGLAIGTTPNPSLVYSVTAGSGTVVLHVTSSGPAPGSYDAWTQYYYPGGGPNAAGDADPIGKGISNTNQFLAGFNPTNSAAYPHIISETKSGNDIVITYLGSNGDTNYPGGPSIRTNYLEAATGTANGSYTNDFGVTVGMNIPSNGTGSGATVTVTDTGGATNIPSRYYRVRVVAP